MMRILPILLLQLIPNPLRNRHLVFLVVELEDEAFLALIQITALHFFVFHQDAVIIQIALQAERFPFHIFRQV